MDSVVKFDAPAKPDTDGLSRATLAGGLVAAILASVCCLGPLVLVMVGVSGAWISNLALLEPFRPVFIGVALIFMGLAWHRIYRAPVAAECEPGTLCALPQTNRVYRVMFWTVSALVLLALAFPYFAPLFY
ncbi:MAG: mercuric ion transporter MerT [Burkholderiales bacterium]